MSKIDYKELVGTKQTNSVNGSIYISHFIEVKGNVYRVLVVNGKFNYVSVTKETNNPYKTLGKEFSNLSEASKNYKSHEMQVELLKIETGLF